MQGSILLRPLRCFRDPVLILRRKVRLVGCTNADRLFAIDEADWFGKFEYRLPDGSITAFRPCDYSWMANFGPATDRPYARMQTHCNWHRVNVTLHRLIMQPPGRRVCIDHINGNPLDNRRRNLRFCNHSQNGANMKIRPRGSSRYKGVYRDGERWAASIQKDRKVMQLGSYETELEAARAYNDAAIRYFGEFARLNELPASGAVA